jgi:serine/threonine protein kinase
VKNRLASLETTCSTGSPRRQLADVLESYLADLEQGCSPDQESLLAAHPDLANELRPYLDSLRLLHGATRDLRSSRPAASNASAESTVSPARQIGDYRIVREIGRGGMGIVYEAHQKSLNRRVALKILPFAAVLDQRQIARFRNEAQAAAQLHHPHIVPVFAVGQEQGVYYYAMQFIDGQSLEQAIGELRAGFALRGERSTKVVGAAAGSTTTLHAGVAKLAASHRSARSNDLYQTVARLGKEAAEALQHAHEYGIVHRDVKPSNLLVDEQGKLWVTDFGLARIQSDSGVTLTGDVVGTLRYMSPEQASGQTALVDARTDVYSLGVTLYELVTQRQAFEGEDRQSLLRQIIGEEPVPPRRHNPTVPIDLETIVMTAMAKSREERYASAQAMAEDLERFLAGRPTLARRPTLGDRAAKWARRHRSLVAVGACALALLSLVSAAGLALLAREQTRTSSALIEAKSSFERAERYLQQARDAVDQFGLQTANRLMEIPGAETVRRDVLLNALLYYRQFMAEAGDDPAFRHEMALAHFKSGVIASRLGAATDAIDEYQQARQLLVELAAGEGALEPRSQLAVTHNNLALLHATRGNVEAARRNYSEAIAIQQRLVEQQPANAVFVGQLAESQANFGMLLDQVGDVRGAEGALRSAVECLRPLAASYASEPKYARNLAIACNNLSFVLRKSDSGAAEAAAQEAVAILERLVQQYSRQNSYLDDLALCYNNLAALASHGQRLAEAIDFYQRAILLQEKLTRTAPAVVRHRGDLAASLNNLGVAYCRASQPTEADRTFSRARELLTALADDYSQEFTYRSSIAALLNNQALALADAQRLEKALELYPVAIEAQRQCCDQSPQSLPPRDMLSKMYYNYRQALQTSGRFKEAAQAALDRRELWRGNASRLLGVAAELADIGHAEPSIQRDLNDEVLATLREVQRAGWPAETDLATDERFIYLHDDESFRVLVAELNVGQQPGRADD